MRSLSACVAAFMLAWLSCREERPGSADAGAVPVKVARVEARDLADAVDLTGTLEPVPGKSVKLGALVAGRIAAITVAEGDRVAAGQVLVQLESTPMKDAVAQAEAAQRQAQAQLANATGRRERAEKLFTAGVAARQEVDDAHAGEVSGQSAVANAEAALSTARNQLSRGELRAPFAGTVAHLFASPGEPVDGSGKPILEVADTRVLELRAAVPPAQAVQLKPGQPARVKVDGLGERGFDGQVAAVAPMIDPATGVGTVRVRVDNADGALKGGAPARARVVLEARPQVLAARAKASPSSASRTARPGGRRSRSG